MLNSESSKAGCLCAGLVAVIALDPLDLVPGAENQRHALVQARRLEFHDPLATSARAAAGLLDDERDRIALIHQPQPPRLSGSLLSLGYRKTPPRVRMR